MKDGRARAGRLILAIFVVIVSVVWLQPYSVFSPYRAYTEPARRFLRAALAQDTVELHRRAASQQPVQNHDLRPNCSRATGAGGKFFLLRGVMEVADAANLGLVRPPWVYLGAIALGLVVHYAWPVRIVPPWVSLPAGAVLTLLAVGLFVASVRTFKAAGTPVPGNQPTSAIVRTGPYRFSRNPIYLAFSLFQLGLSLWVNSLGLLITLIPAVLLMALVVIPREERYLEARFPSEYSSYRALVRRWL